MRRVALVVLVASCGGPERAPSQPAVVDVRETPDAALPAAAAPPAAASPAPPQDAPVDVRRRFAEGRAAYDRADFPRAAAAFEDVVKHDGPPEAMCLLGRTYELMGNRQGAATVYEEYVRGGNLSDTDRRSMELRIQLLRSGH